MIALAIWLRALCEALACWVLCMLADVFAAPFEAAGHAASEVLVGLIEMDQVTQEMARV